jgi:glycosyltransferase involved in cell wall biosynthesis
MRILILGPWVPSARYPVEAERLLRFARHLVNNHRLTLAFATDVPDHSGTILALRAEFQDMEFAVVPRRLRRLWSALRLFAKASVDLTYFDSAALRTRLRDRERTSPFDVVYAASAGMIQHALNLERPGPLVIDFGDLDSEWWERRAAGSPRLMAGLYRAEAARVRELEQAAARRATVAVVSSVQAAERIASLAPGVPVVVVPNGVDPERYPAGPHRATEPVIAFTGSLEGAGGLDAAARFCSTVLPAVRAQVAGARVVIPGRFLPRAARRLARLPGVEIVGNGGDLRGLLRRAAVAVSPSGDSNGARQGALEAMAAGVPLVASRKSLNGLWAKFDREVYVRDDAGSLARRLVELLSSESMRAEVGSRGRAFVRAHHSWEAAAGHVAQVVERVLSITSRASRPAAALEAPPKP